MIEKTISIFNLLCLILIFEGLLCVVCCVIYNLILCREFIIDGFKEILFRIRKRWKGKVTNVKLLPHPKVCPNCNSNMIQYERFLGEPGRYICNDCAWGICADTGVSIYDLNIKD